MKITLSKNKDIYPNSNWVSGSFENRKQRYKFEAKIFAEPSVFGINNGNVSKLWVVNTETKKEIIVYDRGLSVGDKRKLETGMIKELVDFLTEYAIKNWPKN